VADHRSTNIGGRPGRYYRRALCHVRLNSERVVEDHAIDLKQYGFGLSVAKSGSHHEDGKAQEASARHDTPTGNGVYAAVEGDPRVFTIASYSKASLDKTASDLRDKRLLTANFDKVSQIDLTAKKQTVEFGPAKKPGKF